MFDHQFPIVAIDCTGRRCAPLHLVVGPDDNGDQVTALWKWSLHLRKPYLFVTTTNEPVPDPARAGRWTLDTEAFGVLQLRRDPAASCCGDPMKHFHPPGAGRRSTT